MILHIVISDVQLNADLSFEGKPFYCLRIESNDGREYSIYSADLSTSNILRFNETVHTPLHDVNKMAQLTFSLFFVGDGDGAKGGRGGVEIGRGACICSSSDHALVRKVELKSLDDKKKAHLTLTLFYFKAPMEMVEDKGKEFHAAVPNKREYNFLLKRKLISNSRGKKDLPSSFDRSVEKLLDAEVILSYPYLKVGSTASDLVDSLHKNKYIGFMKSSSSARPSPRGNNGNNKANSNKNINYSNSNNNSSNSGSGNGVISSVSNSRRVASKKIEPKTRKTSFNTVGFIARSPVDGNVIESSEENIQKMCLAASRKMMKENEDNAKLESKNVVWRLKVEKIKQDKLQADAAMNKIANLMSEREEEIKQLRLKLMETKQSNEKLTMKVKRTENTLNKLKSKPVQSESDAGGNINAETLKMIENSHLMKKSKATNGTRDNIKREPSIRLYDKDASTRQVETVFRVPTVSSLRKSSDSTSKKTETTTQGNNLAASSSAAGNVESPCSVKSRDTRISQRRVKESNACKDVNTSSTPKREKKEKTSSGGNVSIKLDKEKAGDGDFFMAARISIEKAIEASGSALSVALAGEQDNNVYLRNSYVGSSSVVSSGSSSSGADEDIVDNSSNSVATFVPLEIIDKIDRSYSNPNSPSRYNSSNININNSQSISYKPISNVSTFVPLDILSSRSPAKNLDLKASNRFELNELSNKNMSDSIIIDDDEDEDYDSNDEGGLSDDSDDSDDDFVSKVQARLEAVKSKVRLLKSESDNSDNDD